MFGDMSGMVGADMLAPIGDEARCRSAAEGRTVFSAPSRINLPAERRSVSMVFQSYALWPHMTAFENVAYPLKCRGVRKQELRERVAAALTLVGIPDEQAQETRFAVEIPRAASLILTHSDEHVVEVLGICLR